ncbi:MAG: hypothetical protein ACYDDA_05855 [Acidiferrobacteraceae bacterium]
MSSGGGVLNPINDISNILVGTKNLFVNPAKQFNKYIEPAAIEALPAAIAIGGTIASGGLLAPAALPFLIGGASTYGAQLATEGAGKMFSGTTPSIGDFAIGAAAGGLTFGAQAALSALSAPSSLASTAASTTPNYLTMSASQLASSVAPTTAATSGSGFFGTIGSALGSGLSTVTGALGTTGEILQAAGLATTAYSLIKGKNTAGQCNNVQSLAQQFSSNASSFDNTYQAITASNAQQSLSTLQSLYSQETSLANQISSSGSSCVSSTVISQLQQTLATMQTYIQQVQTYLGQSTSSTSSSASSTSSACESAQQSFTNIVSQFTNAYSSVTTNTASGEVQALQSYYSQAVNIGNEIVSSCGSNSTLTSTIQNYLNTMASDIQGLQSAISNASVSSSASSTFSPISDLTSGSLFNPTSAYAATLPTTSASGASNTIAANSAANTTTWESIAIIGGAVFAVGFITWELTKGVAK